MKQLFLIGPMGVGKTTIGKKVAKKLGVDFRDTDKLIIADHGPISEIFEVHGEEHFRELEQKTLFELADFNGVIATGGGIVVTEKNRDFLRSRPVVYLSTKGKQMRTRMLSAKKRPLLKNGYDDWVRIYENRKRLYEEVCTEEVSIDAKPLAAVADRCAEVYQGGQNA
jgi:shikimate kinase